MDGDVEGGLGRGDVLVLAAEDGERNFLRRRLLFFSELFEGVCGVRGSVSSAEEGGAEVSEYEDGEQRGHRDAPAAGPLRLGQHVSGVQVLWRLLRARFSRCLLRAGGRPHAAQKF